MLKELHIKNLAIIDDLRVSFDAGLNVLTGETGAGKSILIDSLNLVLGSRAQPDLIRSGEKEAVVNACFEIPDIQSLPDIGMDLSEGVIIRRHITQTGRSRAFINDTPVSIQGLSEFGKALVDIHGQHEHQSLMNVEKHCFFLDSFGRLHNDRETVASFWNEVKELKMRLDNLGRQTRDRVQRMDFLRFQIQEIDAANLESGQKEELLKERQILANAGKLKELAENAYQQIYGAEGSCTEQLSSVKVKLKEMNSFDKGVEEILNLLDSAIPFIEDASGMLRSYKEKYDVDPVRLNEVEERLELIKKLEKKYGEGIENLLKYREDAAKELQNLETVDEEFGFLEAEVAEKEEKFIHEAKVLSEKRKGCAVEMERLVMKELKDLAFSNAVFVIEIKEEELAHNGIDRVEFLFSANVGEPPKPLVKIASGGELSRVMLALKALLADFDNIPVLVFDEVDAGIGGRTAETVGMKLKKLSERHQVLCATHLPQIASKADLHLSVEKDVRNKRASVGVSKLSGKERLHELARMLSGTATEVSLRHAKELLGAAETKNAAGPAKKPTLFN